MTIQEIYNAHGVRFRYPSHWELKEQQNDSELSITVESGETSFWSLVLLPDGPDPSQMIKSAVDTFREEYDEIDIYPVQTTICHRTGVGRDLEFVCLEMVNSAFLRAFRTGRFSALILYQGTDRELAETRETLESILASLECEGDEAIFQ